MMPDLPNVDFDRDLESFREFFESPAFRSDGLKIYPTLVIRGTGLYELWKTGRSGCGQDGQPKQCGQVDYGMCSRWLAMC